MPIHSFIEQYNRKRARLKHLCRCLLANWNLDQNSGKVCNITNVIVLELTPSFFFIFKKQTNDIVCFKTLKIIPIVELI